MPLPKEYYYAGNGPDTLKSFLAIALGLIGAAFILVGFTQTPAQLYYVIGSSLMLITAIYFKLTYFMALEMILLSGHGAILLGIGPVIQLFLPVLLSLQLFVYYWLSGQLRNIFRLIGVAGITLLSIGFSYENPWIFFFGSLSVAIFGFHKVYQGSYVVLIWAVLNLFFTCAIGLTLFSIVV